MEQFQDGHHVRLRSREHGMYLHANKDGRGVSLRRPRASMNAAWAVHLYQDDDDAQYVLLHSAAYGGYLAAMDAPAPLGHCGRRVEQRDYEEREEEDVRWQPVRFGSGDYILLRHASGRFLRANGKYLPWNNGASVDDFDTVSTMTHWVVERIPAREGMPEEILELENPNLVHLSKQQETHIFGLELVLHVGGWPCLCSNVELRYPDVGAE
uniref:Uncharacterized protein n=1 Tax=Aegilops tauschii TaxID=37682 RepID=M8C5S6_AEGTA